MARPTSRSRRQTPIPSINLEGLSAKTVEFERKETTSERDQRLKKDWWSFVVEDFLATVVAFIVLIALVAISTVLLFRSTLPDDRHFATSTLAAVGTAVVGFAFGKATKK